MVARRPACIGVAAISGDWQMVKSHTFDHALSAPMPLRQLHAFLPMRSRAVRGSHMSDHADACHARALEADVEGCRKLRDIFASLTWSRTNAAGRSGKMTGAMCFAESAWLPGGATARTIGRSRWGCGGDMTCGVRQHRFTFSFRRNRFSDTFIAKLVLMLSCGQRPCAVHRRNKHVQR